MTERRVALVDVADLGRLLRRRRTALALSLRDVEAQLDGAMTASSLSRLEHGAVPDAKNVPALAKWLELPLDRIGWPGEEAQDQELPVPDVVEVHLRADRNLDPQAAEVLSTMFRHLYESVAGGTFPIPEQRSKSKD